MSLLDSIQCRLGKVNFSGNGFYNSYLERRRVGWRGALPINEDRKTGYWQSLLFSKITSWCEPQSPETGEALQKSSGFKDLDFYQSIEKQRQQQMIEIKDGCSSLERSGVAKVMMKNNYCNLYKIKNTLLCEYILLQESLWEWHKYRHPK